MKKFLPLIIGIAMVIIGWKLWDGNSKSSLKDQESKYKELCEQGVKVMATMQNQYTETTINSLKMYTYKLDYTVEGQSYTKEKTTNILPKEAEIELTYLPSTPQTAETGDMCKQYEEIKSDSSSSFLLYLGIGMFFIGIIVAYGSFKGLIRNLIKGNKNPTPKI